MPTFEDLPGKWQAAIVKAEQNRPKLRVVTGDSLPGGLTGTGAQYQVERGAASGLRASCDQGAPAV
jgi:hypothetical protein